MTRGVRNATAAAVGAVALGVLAYLWWPTPSSSMTHDDRPRFVAAAPDRPPVDGRRRLSAPLGAADGVVPDGVTVFDDDVPAVANLDPDLLDALRRAADDAGLRFVVNSGWRSPQYQEQLLQDAIAEYGSAEEAARWVSTPQTSLHVSGDAVDLGPAEVQAWLDEHGAGFGLCRIYRNEPWHFELRPEAVENGCPARYDDPTHDPRMNQ